MTRRDLPLAASLLPLLLALLPAYGRVLADGTWRVPVLLAGALAIVVAATVRALRGGPLGAAVVSLLGLVSTLYVLVLPDVGLLPDASSWGAYRGLLEQAALDLREQPSPAPTTTGFLAALVTAAWLVGHLAHELLVRLRSPGAALVPVLVLWAVPLAIPVGDAGAGALARTLPFLAAAGLVLLLGGDAAPEGDRPPRVTASGLAVGAGTLAAVLIAPTLLPAYDAAAMLDLGGSADPRGYQPIVDVSERLQQPTERDVLLVRADHRSYLRLAGLDSFDGNTWRLGPSGESSYRPPDDALFPGTRALPPEEPAQATTEVTAEVEVLDLANIYVPAPYQPTAITGPLRDQVVWSTDGGFLATWSVAEAGPDRPRVGVTQGASYRVEAQRPTPTVEQLRAAEADEATRQRWTQLPGDFGLGELAEQVYADAGAASDVDRALALQRWFTDTDRFTYDLDVPPLRGPDALRDFVADDRRGYCEYFATAMAVMLRETGIPARVAVGFLPGEVTLAADEAEGRDLTEYTVSTGDAHAWVEVLFPGYGWITFEPTPRDDGAQMEPTEQDLAPQETVAERQARAEEEAEAADDEAADEPDAPEDVPEPEVEEPQAQERDTADAADDERSGASGWLLGLALLAAVAALLVVVSRPRQAVAGSDAAGRIVTAQRQVLLAGQRYASPRQPAETLPELLTRWRDEGRVDADAVRFASLAQSAAFGGTVGDGEADRGAALAESIEAQLRATADRRERLTAPLRPTWDALRERLERLRARLPVG